MERWNDSKLNYKSLQIWNYPQKAEMTHWKAGTYEVWESWRNQMKADLTTGSVESKSNGKLNKTQRKAEGTEILEHSQLKASCLNHSKSQ